MSPTTATAAPNRLPPASLATLFGGVWRLTFPRFLAPRHLLSATGCIAGLGLLSWVQARHGHHELLGWIQMSYLGFLVPIIAFVTAAGAIRDDLKSSTVDYVLTRTIPRPVFIVARFIAHVTVVEIEFLLALAVLVGVAAGVHTPGLAPALPTMVTSQLGVVLAFSGFGFLCGILTSRYLVVGLIYGAIVEIGVGQIPTQLNRISMTHQVRTLLQPFIDAAGTGSAATNTPAVLSTGLVLVAFSAVTLAIAAAVFRFRELSGNVEP